MILPPPPDPEIRAAVEQLLSEFCHRIDNGLGATIHELFADDGRVETPAFVLTGKPEIETFFTARSANKGRISRHYWSNLRLTVDGDRVDAITNVMTAVNEGGRQQLMGGSSFDSFLKTPDGWAFTSRRLELIFSGFLTPEAPQ